MKKTYLILIGLFTIISCGKSEDILPPEETEEFVNIPDATFKDYLLQNDQWDVNQDGEISYSEAENITFIDINIPSSAVNRISNTIGIESFINLTSLKMTFTDVTSIDLSNNQKLRYIYLGNNKIEEIIITTIPELKEFYAQGNFLTELDLSGCNKLERVDVPLNNLISLNVNGLTELQRLWFYDNNITNINLSNNSKIYSLECANNDLSTLNVSNMTELERLTCGNNDNLTTICVYDKTYAENSPYFIKPDSAQWIDDCD